MNLRAEQKNSSELKSDLGNLNKALQTLIEHLLGYQNTCSDFKITERF